MGRILIVDDTLFMRTLLKNILFSGGHEIVGEAGDGAEAVEKYQALKPDLVTMDVVMPKMNGIEALKEIKKFDPGAKV
ncbi:response regulator, partial [Methanocalculus sp.]